MGAGHAHVHDHGEPGTDLPPTPPEVRRLLTWVLVPVALLTVLGLALLWPDAPEVDGGRRPLPRLEATVRAVDGEVATVRLEEGARQGREVAVRAPVGEGAPRLSPGDGVVVTDDARVPGLGRYTVVDFPRGSPLVWLAAGFALAVVVFGRLHGLRALVGLVVGFGVLVAFVLPAVLEGTDPLLVAVVGSSATMFVTLYLAHGVSCRTSVAVLGTLLSLALTGGLGAAAASMARLTGLATEEAAFLRTVYGDVDAQGLLLAGIVIGALGVLDDVTVTQASAVFEIRRAAPAMSSLDVYRAGVRIGRDHVASTVNTLVLAYAGASLPLLLLFTGGGAPVADVLTSELVAQEVVRSLVGGLGIVAAVPVTTALAVAVAGRGAAAGRRSTSRSGRRGVRGRRRR